MRPIHEEDVLLAALLVHLHQVGDDVLHRTFVVKVSSNLSILDKTPVAWLTRSVLAPLRRNLEILEVC